MKKLLLVILGASLGMLSACGEGTSPDNQATVLQFSQHGAIEDQSEEYYHNQADFQAEWNKLYANESSKPALPNVDFTKNTVVVYTIGQQKHGGYQIRVLRALPIQNGYAVGFQVTVPGLGCHNETQETTKPFIVITVPTTQDITFDEVNKREQPSCTAK
ncbi:MAG TPA: protease complex subunit PrcB family protein [Gammaproteobacteria bacterium]|nr:protease complex subunit PrcB family protein [Gammaproteobacteria bacterium]